MPKIFKSELTLEIPKDVKFKLDGKTITVEGDKGKITKNFTHMKGIDLFVDKNNFILKSYFPRKGVVSKMGTLKSIVQNMIIGVVHGYTYKMKIAYSHFPITVEVDGEKILIKNFIGERNPRVTLKASKDIDVKTSKEDVVISGIDKEYVGQTAANIQKRCRIRKKDKRVFQDGIYIYEKYAGDEPIWKLKV